MEEFASSGEVTLGLRARPLSILEEAATVIRPDVTANHGRAKVSRFTDGPHSPKWSFTLTLAVGLNLERQCGRVVRLFEVVLR
jgi:hypothetical protein